MLRQMPDYVRSVEGSTCVSAYTAYETLTHDRNPCMSGQMADFMRSVEGDVRAAEEAEQAAAERFATERGEREAFEQRWGSWVSSRSFTGVYC